MPTPVIVSAARTAIGKFGGSFSQTPATQLGAVAIGAALERASANGNHLDPLLVDEVLIGQVIQAGAGMAPARQAAIQAGLPPSVGASTINKVCGSGLQAVMLAAAGIRAGDGRCYVAGGMESMNQGPYLLPQARFGYRLNNAEMVDATVYDGLRDPFEKQHVALAAEWLAETYEITRHDQDAFALESQRRAAAAADAGRFQAEIVPVPLREKRQVVAITADEAIRRDTSLEKLAALPPAFKAEGTITAGNAPGITDGAAALVVMEAGLAAEQGLEPLARIVSYARHALEPHELFTAPPFAIRKALALAGWQMGEVDLFEINEAFAAQMVHNCRELDLDPAKVNVNGGAIALGHPLGASGARILVTLLHALAQRGLRRGVAALCLGGGEAVAMVIERNG
ncbi:MAG: thiolase family protein [Caldilineales bacterium]|nr:thiolase family protein [Caldilineales bacterium]